jgi:hypothetical protein
MSRMGGTAANSAGRGAGELRAGLSRETHRVIFIFSLALVAFCSYGLFTNHHEALIVSIFAVLGASVAVLQLFVAFPLLPVMTEPVAHPGASHHPPGAPAPKTADWGSLRSAARIPVVYGLAFLVAGVLSIFQQMIIFSGGVVSDNEVFTNAVISGVIVGVLVAFAFPGFHALQAARGGYASLVGSALGATAAILSVLLLWIREDALVIGIGSTPGSYLGLALPVNGLDMIGSVLLAIAIKNARVYPRWTAAAKLIGAFLAFVFILLNGHYGAFMLNVYRLNGLLQGAAFLTFGWYMVSFQIKAARLDGRI